MKKEFLLLILLAMLLIGCEPIENNFINEVPSHFGTNGPMTTIEYTDKANRLIVPLMNEGETFLAHHLDIVKGKFSIKQEIAMVENTIDRVQETIEEIDGLQPPTDYIEQKAQTINRLNEYKDALKKYKKALEEEDVGKIKASADYLKSILASLKTAHDVYHK